MFRKVNKTMSLTNQKHVKEFICCKVADLTVMDLSLKMLSYLMSKTICFLNLFPYLS